MARSKRRGWQDADLDDDGNFSKATKKGKRSGDYDSDEPTPERLDFDDMEDPVDRRKFRKLLDGDD